MAGALANSTNRLRVTLKDQNSALVTGATVTLTVKDPTAAVVINNVSVPEVGTGIYEYIAAPAAWVTDGTFTAIWNAVDASARVWHHEEQFVVAR